MFSFILYFTGDHIILVFDLRFRRMKESINNFLDVVKMRRWWLLVKYPRFLDGVRTFLCQLKETSLHINIHFGDSYRTGHFLFFVTLLLIKNIDNITEKRIDEHTASRGGFRGGGATRLRSPILEENLLYDIKFLL